MIAQEEGDRDLRAQKTEKINNCSVLTEKEPLEPARPEVDAAHKRTDMSFLNLSCQNISYLSEGMGREEKNGVEQAPDQEFRKPCGINCDW